MNKNTIFAVLIVTALFVLSSCAQQETTGGGGTTFIGGTEGLALEFLPEAPPNDVFDGGKFPFTVNLRLTNVGEWEIPNGAQIVAEISGIDPADFSLTPAALKKNPPQGMLPARLDPNGDVIDGDILVMDFPGFNYKNTLYGDVSATIKADVCYSYGTKFVSTMCIKKDLSSKDDSVCTVTESKDTANSAAPVQITSFKEAQGGTDKVILTFLIEHVGEGDIFEKGSQCADVLEKKNKVYLKLNTGMAGLVCSGLQTQAGQPTSGSEGYVVLYGDQRQISCTQPTGGQGDFEKTISATLEYDYNQFIKKLITIKHV
ncbi:hypothetical protein KY308_04155 [Candidatus Woesearchaeota archaeon]|nr:hypothetical protein [Candidatus Woesearchaeota archaeon]